MTTVLEPYAEHVVYIDGHEFPIPLGGRLAWSTDRAVRRGARLGGRTPSRPLRSATPLTPARPVERTARRAGHQPQEETAMTVTQEKRWTQDGRPSLNRGAKMVDGPWVDEPDKAHWIDAATNMDCLALRNRMGAWCGYVAVTEDHPWFEVGYGECPDDTCESEWCYEHSPEGKTAVHGGLTYSAFCAESERGEGFGICHVPLSGRPERVWWFGFDTAHCGDASPYDHAKAAVENAYPWFVPAEDSYRTLDYVQDQCADLARQLSAVSA